MSSLPVPLTARPSTYPTSDGKPMAETEQHRDLMFDLIHSLEAFYADRPRVHVTGNLLLYYEQGNRRKHVSPDIFVAFGVEKRQREYYLLWEEGQPPRLVIELTSSSTRKEDQVKKFNLYRDVLKVREYFLFDPNEDYLKPPMQGWRLHGGAYRPITAVEDRLPSATTGLHLERAGRSLRLWNPDTRAWLPTQQEALEAESRARQEAQRQVVDAQAEIQRLRRMLGQQPTGDPT